MRNRNFRGKFNKWSGRKEQLQINCQQGEADFSLSGQDCKLNFTGTVGVPPAASAVDRRDAYHTQQVSPAEAAQAVLSVATSSRPSSLIICSRRINFCTLPLAVNG